MFDNDKKHGQKALGAANVDIREKLSILADAAKYDASCASSGTNRKPGGNIGNVTQCGICHSFAGDGRCISLLKVLKTNVCRYDCAYCHNRRSNDVPRATFTARELCELTMEFYRRNYIEGLFLSSAVTRDPDTTMEELIRTLELVRGAGFGGYIHAKAIPGADRALVERLGRLCDRMSVNIELPSAASLCELAPDKTREAILNPMGYIGSRVIQRNEERRLFTSAPEFAPAGQSTQLIVGATAETDRQILRLSQGLYRSYGMRRVYYSAYTPVNHAANLPDIPRAPLLREHRLYQSDWLMRFYGFTAEELLTPDRPNLDERVDPKCGWALRHLDEFPVEILSADYNQLMRVPGIGMISARRICEMRRSTIITESSLKRLGVVMKRARHFITLNGRYLGWKVDERPIRAALTAMDNAPAGLYAQQLSFFDEPQSDWQMLDAALKRTTQHLKAGEEQSAPKPPIDARTKIQSMAKANKQTALAF